MTFLALPHRWRTDPRTAPSITAWRVQSPRPADWRGTAPRCAAPPGRPAAGGRNPRPVQSPGRSLARGPARRTRGGRHRNGSSGKTLCYNLPVLAALEENPSARALYLTSHRSHSRKTSCPGCATGFPRQRPSTAMGIRPPPSVRPSAGKRASCWSNPDMLHTGILPASRPLGPISSVNCALW